MNAYTKQNMEHDVDAEYAAKLQAELDAQEAADESEEEQHERRRRKKKSRRGSSNNQNDNAGQQQFGDSYNRAEDLEIEQGTKFSREHFARLIKKTFDDYHPL